MTGEKAGEHWALAMTPDGKFLAATTHDGRVNIYDTTKIDGEVKATQTMAQFETKGSFGTCVDIVRTTHSSALLESLILTVKYSLPTAR